ncbi:MAG TPA: aminotransferase class III-fold pyridoxal phosphate-dependent enzyme [Pyrinomonadaceae bacterium]|jgi:glutamate-1-semialdehyde aminotransferase/acyl carrier protein
MSESQATAPEQTVRRDSIIKMVADVLARLFGRDASELDIHTPLINMGADSLFLLQASQAIKKTFDVKVPFRLLLEELSTIAVLAEHLEGKLPPEFAAANPTRDTAPAAAAAPPPPAHAVTAPNVAAEPPRTAAVAESPTLRETAPPATPGREANFAPAPHVSAKATAFDSTPVAYGDGAEPDDVLQQIIAQQLQISAQQLEIMSQQLELLRGGEARAEHAPAANESTQAEPTAAPPQHLPAAATVVETYRAEVGAGEFSVPGGGSPVASANAPAAASVNTAATGGAKGGAIEPETFVPFQPFKKNVTTELDERQRAHLDGLIARINRRMPKSKQLTETYRPVLADSRAVAGFRMLWKEMVFPVVVERGEGSHIWDVDGNEYVDMNMGFGSLLFGHSPAFIIETMQEQLKHGLQLGPQAHVAGQVAQLICELTGVERAAFCNSGTEAVMTALRIARAVTGRSKIALFEGCYHGTFDGVLVRGDKAADGSLRAVPMAPGVPQHMIEDVLLLKYNSPESIETIKAHAHELAAVLIEPPRSRRPDVQPKAFLQELRRLTEEAGVAFIFDEVVTGFRFHPGGAQAMFDIKADLVTYGKAVAGGLPAAVIAGRAAYMDAVDGGQWNYGDASYPEADVTYFTGTYFKHPLIMPALLATLNHVKERGLKLQEELDEKTSYVVDALNAYLTETGTPMKVVRLGSLFRFLYPGELKYADLFYYHLLEKGVYLSETRNFFMSSAHTAADLEHLIRAAKESIEELRAAGFMPSVASPDATEQANARAVLSVVPPATAAPTTEGAPATEAARVPLTESQKQVWALAQLSDEGARAYNLSTALRLRGPLDVAALRSALQQVVDRHEALRATFSPAGDYQQIAPAMQVNAPLIDFSQSAPGEREAEVATWLGEEAQREFDLAAGPLLKAFILKLEEERHIFVLTAHHLITDGWSFGTLLGELKEIYSATRRGVSCELMPPKRFSDYARQQAARQQSREMADAESFWLTQFAGARPVLNLPTDRPRADVQTFAGAQLHMRLNPDLSAGLRALGAREGCTQFMILLAAFKVLLHHLTDQRDLVVGIPSAGQISPDGGYLIGYCVNLLPLRSQVEDGMTFTGYLNTLKGVLADAYDYQDYPFSKLLKRLNLPREPGRSPLVEVVFNLDRAGASPNFYGLEVEVAPNHNHSSKFDLTFDVTETPAGLTLDCEYALDLFERETARLWMEHYETILSRIAAHPDITIDELRDELRTAEQHRRAAERQELEQVQLKKISKMKRKAVHQ